MTRPSPGLLWKRWKRTEAEKPAGIVYIDAPTGRSYSAKDLTVASEARTEFDVSCAGKIVAFCLPNTFEWLAVFLAIQRAGGAVMPLDAGIPLSFRAEKAAALGANYYWVEGKLTRLKRLGKVAAVVNPLEKRPAVIKVTSGTTSGGCAIRCSSSHLIADGTNIIMTMGIRKTDRNLGLIPFGHSYALGNLIMPLIMQGTAIVGSESFLPSQIPEWLQVHKATVLPSVPTVFRLLAESSRIAALPGLRLAISAGAVLAPDIAVHFHERFGIKIHNFYGSSETGGICYDRTGNSTLRGTSIGRPLESVRVSVKAGRIEVTGKAVATGTGRFRLPDNGELNARGELKLLGRADLAVNIGGKKVHPDAVGSALRGIAGVSDARVIPLHFKGRHILGAAIESRLPQVHVESALRAMLPEWQIPRKWVVVETLPRTGRGKLDPQRVDALLGS